MLRQSVWRSAGISLSCSVSPSIWFATTRAKNSYLIRATKQATTPPLREMLVIGCRRLEFLMGVTNSSTRFARPFGARRHLGIGHADHLVHARCQRSFFSSPSWTEFRAPHRNASSHGSQTSQCLGLMTAVSLAHRASPFIGCSQRSPLLPSPY